MNYETQNAMKLLHEKRQRRAQWRQAQPVQELLPEAKKMPALPPSPVPVIDWQAVRNLAGLTTLDTLTTDHMSLEQGTRFNAILKAVKAWRRAVGTKKGLSFVLCSPEYGIGKTHMARAMVDSMVALLICPDYYDKNTKPAMNRYAKMLTSRQTMEMMANEDWRELIRIGLSKPRMIAIDDIGREGILPYVKQDAESQQREIQARYYELVNYCYMNEISLFITSNFSLTDLEKHFNGATWSRLNELAPRGYMWNVGGFVDYRNVVSGR